MLRDHAKAGFGIAVSGTGIAVGVPERFGGIVCVGLEIVGVGERKEEVKSEERVAEDKVELNCRRISLPPMSSSFVGS